MISASLIPTVTYQSETWNLYETTNLKTQNYRESQRKNFAKHHMVKSKTISTGPRKNQIMRYHGNDKKTEMELGSGHVARRTDKHWTTRITLCMLRGHTRNEGRPRTRWGDNLDSLIKIEWGKFHKTLAPCHAKTWSCGGQWGRLRPKTGIKWKKRVHSLVSWRSHDILNWQRNCFPPKSLSGQHCKIYDVRW